MVACMAKEEMGEGGREGGREGTREGWGGRDGTKL